MTPVISVSHDDGPGRDVLARMQALHCRCKAIRARRCNPMKIQACALTALSMMAVAVYAQKENIHQRSIKEPLHFCKAEDFWQMDGKDRELYASGLADGFLAIGFFDAPDEKVTWITSCVRSMDSKQVSAIIAKYIKDHPEWSNRSASGNAYFALVDACPVPGKISCPEEIRRTASVLVASCGLRHMS